MEIFIVDLRFSNQVVIISWCKSVVVWSRNTTMTEHVPNTLVGFCERVIGILVDIEKAVCGDASRWSNFLGMVWESTAKKDF